MEWLSRISPFYVDDTEPEASSPTPSTHQRIRDGRGGRRKRGWKEEDHDKDEIWQRVPRLWLLTVRVVRLLLPLMLHFFHHHHHHHPRTFIERLLCAGHCARRPRLTGPSPTEAARPPRGAWDVPLAPARAWASGATSKGRQGGGQSRRPRVG